MIILFAANQITTDAEGQISEWRANGHIVEELYADRLISYIRFDPGSSRALVDVIVCASYDEWRAEFTFESADRLENELRSLPDSCAMWDGRKWNALPFLKLSFSPTSPHTVDAMTNLARIKGAVDEYEQAVLDDYENVGLMVRFVGGRAQIGPALKRKHPDIQSTYYYSPADRRENRGWVTVFRDDEGVRQELTIFEELINRRATETEMHRFFEENPAFLMDARLGIPISHRPRFVYPDGETPDFSVLPVFDSVERGDNIQLLELKAPGEILLTRGRHAGFSAKVHHAVDQARDYERWVHDRRNEAALERSFGFVPENTKLAVVIGRTPKSSADEEILRRRRGELNVEIVTYDEILHSQENRILKSQSPIIVTPELYSVRPSLPRGRHRGRR